MTLDSASPPHVLGDVYGCASWSVSCRGIVRHKRGPLSKALKGIMKS